MKCESCKFWECTENNFGICKRHAPSPIVTMKVDEMSYQIVWPLTGKDDSCGEYKVLGSEE